MLHESEGIGMRVNDQASCSKPPLRGEVWVGGYNKHFVISFLKGKVVVLRTFYYVICPFLTAYKGQSLFQLLNYRILKLHAASYFLIQSIQDPGANIQYPVCRLVRYPRAVSGPVAGGHQFQQAVDS